MKSSSGRSSERLAPKLSKHNTSVYTCTAEKVKAAKSSTFIFAGRWGGE